MTQPGFHVEGRMHSATRVRVTGGHLFEDRAGEMGTGGKHGDGKWTVGCMTPGSTTSARPPVEDIGIRQRGFSGFPLLDLSGKKSTSPSRQTISSMWAGPVQRFHLYLQVEACTPVFSGCDAGDGSFKIFAAQCGRPTLLPWRAGDSSGSWTFMTEAEIPGKSANNDGLQGQCQQSAPAIFPLGLTNAKRTTWWRSSSLTDDRSARSGPPSDHPSLRVPTATRITSSRSSGWLTNRAVDDYTRSGVGAAGRSPSSAAIRRHLSRPRQLTEQTIS
jgi:hypothetical protein